MGQVSALKWLSTSDLL